MSAFVPAHVRAGSAVEMELKRLHGIHGMLTNKIVLEAAKDPHSPLYKQFEWDNTIAGELYRLEQASRIISAVVHVWQLLEERKKPATVTLVTYASVGGGKKVERTTAMSDAEMRKHIIRSKLNRLKSTVVSVSDVQELDHLRRQVVKMVDATAAKLQIDLD